MRVQVSVLLMLLAGCASQGPKVTRLERREAPGAAQPAQVELPKIEPKPIEPIRPVKPAAPAPTPAPTAVATPAQTPAPAPLTGWISLKNWCAENKIEGPTLKVT